MDKMQLVQWPPTHLSSKQYNQQFYIIHKYKQLTITTAAYAVSANLFVHWQKFQHF